MPPASSCRIIPPVGRRCCSKRSPNAQERKNARVPPSKFVPNYPASLEAVLLDALAKRKNAQECPQQVRAELSRQFEGGAARGARQTRKNARTQERKNAE